MARAWNGLRQLLALQNNRSAPVPVPVPDPLPAPVPAPAASVDSSPKPNDERPQRNKAPVADHNKPPQFNESEMPVLNSEWLGNVQAMRASPSSLSDKVAGIEPLSDTANKGSTKPAVRRVLFKSSETISRRGKENIQNIKHQNNEISHSQAENKVNSQKEAGPSHSKASTHANMKVTDTAVRKRPTHSLSNNSSVKKVKQNNDDQDFINSDLGIIGPLSSCNQNEKGLNINDSKNAEEPGARKNLMTKYQEARRKAIAENEAALQELLQSAPSPAPLSKAGVKRKNATSKGSPKKKRSRIKTVISRKSQRKSSAPPKYTESGSSCSSSRSASPCSIEGSETDSLAESFYNSDSDASSSRSLSSEKGGSSPKSGRNPDVAENVSPFHIPNESPQRNGVSPNCSPQKTPKTPKTPASQKALKKAAIKLKRKTARNLGKEYETDQGITVEDRESKRKPPHEICKNNCIEKITPDIADTLFKEYWEQGSHNKRVAYVVARTERFGVARRRPRTHVDSREKHQNFKYFFDVNGKRLRVCRSTFLGTLGETDRFVRDVTENKKKSVSGIAKDDTRGKKRPKHALKPEVRLAVLNHIESFPAYESHYCRAQTQRLYLSPELNVQKMHELYLASQLPKVSYDVYRKLFKSTKKKFHAPKSDGCDTCDTLKVQIAAAVGEEKTKLESTKELHNRKADKAYLLKREAKAAAEKDKKKRVLIFDLQQCLPTPHLKCKKIYYSRQLNVLNFTIYDSTTKLTHCYMWSEIEGRRGSNEIASCLLDYILKEVPSEVKELKLFSDCCSGQNRNSTVAMMLFLALQEHPSIQQIDHIFLVPGHTFMPEVDSKHSVIEKYKRKLEKVNVPDEWYEHVDQAGRTDKKHFPDGKFRVHHITKFLDISSLASGPLVKRTVCIDKQPMNYLDTHWFKYIKGEEGHVHVKHNFNEETAFKTLSFLRIGQKCGQLPKLLATLPTTQEGPLPISHAKRNDLLNLLPFLDNKYHEFYQSINSLSDVVD